MIEVNVRLDGITIEGHAGYAEAGKDIVCAGVTALTENLIDSIESLTKDTIQFEISPGRVDIHYKDVSGSGKLLVDSFFLGICSIEQDFPEVTIPAQEVEHLHQHKQNRCLLMTFFHRRGIRLNLTAGYRKPYRLLYLMLKRNGRL